MKSKSSCWLSLGLFFLSFPVLAQPVVLNEIMYHPSSQNVLEEYVELYNRSTNTLNLLGWRFTRGVGFTFTNQVDLRPGDYLVVAADVAAFRAKYPAVTNVVGGWVGVLGNNGEGIRLDDAFGQEVDQVDYADQGEFATRRRGFVNTVLGWRWEAPHDGLGPSLELINSALSNDAGQNWGASSVNGGTPGRQNSIRSVDIAPVILEVKHVPPVPRSTDSVTVTCRLLDEVSGGATLQLWYRDHTTGTPGAFSSMAMLDDGRRNDGVAGDGIYGAVLPPRPDGTVIEFYLESTDGDNSRTWPAVALDQNGVPGQLANLVYQVDNSVYAGAQPIFRLVLTATDQATLTSGQQTDAQINATLITIDGARVEVRYNVGVRIRGAGSRGRAVKNFRVNIPHDREWNGLGAINLNAQYGHAQVAGSAIALEAGLPVARARPIQVRVNGQNLASVGDLNGYGSYALLEPVNGELAENHFPADGGGNVYRASRAPWTANLDYLGPNPASYRNAGYSKTSNTSEDDWSDLINLTYALSPNTLDGDYVEVVRAVADVEEWLLYFVVCNFFDYRETALCRGVGDDYAMYSGVKDPRFRLIAHDFDTILGQGDTAGSTTRSLWVMIDNPASFNTTERANFLERFMRHPEFAPIYFRLYKEHLDTTFAAEQINPLLDRLLSWVPEGTINDMKNFAAARRAYLLTQIPTNLTVTTGLQVVSGFPRATSSTVFLSGLANIIETRSVRVNGTQASWTAWQGAWSINGVGLMPGINRVLVQGFDGNDREIQRVTVDIWYDDGSAANVSGTLASSTNWTAAAGPYNITGNVTVPAGVTLTIEPGTTLYFTQGTTLGVNGRLVAEGTETQHIRFTRQPGTANTWGGLVFNASEQDNRLRYVDFDQIASGDGVRLINSRLLIEHATWTNITRTIIELDTSSLILRDSVLPSLAGRELIHGGPMPVDGEVIIQRNIFGTTTGLNDIIDFTGAQRPGSVLQILDNIFTAASDDVLDLDGTDAHIEGNVFMHVHNGNFSDPDTASAISSGQDGGYGPHLVVVRNLFVDVDHVALVKEGGFLTLVNNTAFGIGVAALNFSEPERATLPGAGAYLDGNIFWNTPPYAGTNFQNRFPTNGTVALTVNRSILLPGAGLEEGEGNLSVDPRLANPNTNTISVLTVWDDLQLLPGSPAIGAGPNGLDMGGAVPAGASIAGEPSSPTFRTGATLTVDGPGIVTYQYRLNNGPLSSETGVTNPIVLSGLTNGTYAVYVRGRNSAGVQQAATNLTVSKTWEVNTLYSRLVINEILARNDHFVFGNGFPDLVELHNAGGTTLDLSGMGLTDEPAKPYKFTFPAGASLDPGDYLILIADQELTPAQFYHLGFALNQDGDGLHLYSSPDQGVTVLDSVTFGLQLPDLSIGRWENGSWGLTVPTFGSPNRPASLGRSSALRLNEWLAVPQTLFQEDFIELYNPEPVPVPLGGLYLTDEPLSWPNRHQIPALSFLAAFGHLALVADGDAAAGADHVGFQLAGEAGQIGLFNTDLSLIDEVLYLTQSEDVSEGRRPSGADLIGYFGPATRTAPTPGGPNPGTGGTIIVTNVVVNLLSMASDWRYDYSNTDLGTDWRAAGYDDSGWFLGPALLGSEGSALPAPGLNTFFPPFTVNNNEYYTFYFRTAFQLNTNLDGFALSATTAVDDGCLVYLNGTEALRIRLPAGTIITHTTEALAPSVNNAVLETWAFPSGSLLQGTNVLAVEVHQAQLPSSDIVWGMSLAATMSFTNPPNLAVVLNEVMASNLSITNIGQTNATDWVEIYNPSDTLLDLSGLSLSDALTEPRRWVFPQGVTLSPREYLLVAFDSLIPPSTNTTGFLNTGFGLNRGGDSVFLFDHPANGGALLDSISFGLQAAEFSIGRIPNAEGGWVLTLPTPRAGNVPASLGLTRNLAINEWMANPAAGDDDFFEIYNANAQPVDLGGLFLTDDLNDRDKFKIAPLSFVGVGENAFALFIADNNPQQGADHVNFGLSRDGEALGIFTGNGDMIHGLSFGPQQNDVSEGLFPDGSTNRTRFVGTASPGRSNLLPLDDVVISEVLSHSDPPLEDAIELYNHSLGSVDLSGWYLSDNRDEPRKFRIPEGTVLESGRRLVFYEYQFNANPDDATSFALSSAEGDDLYLFSADLAGHLTGYRGGVRFGPVESDVSFGRYATSVGFDFPRMSARTFGADNAQSVEEFRTGTGLPNADPLVGPVVISEIMYHPPEIGTNENVLDEFVELHNTSGGDVRLYDFQFPTNRWRLKDAVQFTFPADTILPAGGYLLVVSFDPATNLVALTDFRAKYGLAESVRIFGPYDGQLSNNRDSVELAAPDTPEPPEASNPGLVPFVDVDQVGYADENPWPEAADGATNVVLGYSLHRRELTHYGNDPINWQAGTPTPGGPAGAPAMPLPFITTQPRGQTVAEGQNVVLNALVSGTGSTLQWRFNGIDIAGATTSFLQINNARLTNSGTYTLRVHNPAGTILSDPALLTVQAGPEITKQPESRVVLEGARVVLTVAARGTPPLAYLWWHNSQSLPAETNTVLVIPQVSPADEGDYWVVVSNAFDAVTSSVATVVISAPPRIVSQPQGTNVYVGSNVVFTVSVTGSPPLRYQWRRGGITLPGATNAVLALNNVQPGDSGDYTVQVVNSVGSIVSDPATLVVRIPATLSITATDGVASEPGADTGTLTILRGGEMNTELSINLTVSGSAVAGQDYDPLSSPVLLPAGASQVALTVQVRDDALQEGDETVTVTLAAGADYVLGAPTSATVLVRDEDNLPPSVTITNPVEGAVFNASATIPLGASAADDVAVVRVDFFDNQTNLLGTLIAPPFVLSWPNAPSGIHVLTAVATDNLGSTAVSAPVTITVNAAPAVVLTSPADGQNFVAPANINLSATATDGDGSIALVEFFAGTNLIGSTTSGSGTTPRADYQFQDTRASTVPGAPDLTDLGNNTFANATIDGVGRRVLRFTANNGVSLSAVTSLVPSDVYSLVLLFTFDETNSFRRIIDFRTGTADDGVYAFNGSLWFFPVTNSPAVVVRSNQYVQLVLTRESNGNVAGYANGVLQFRFVDNGNLAGLGVSDVLRFFRDDGNEAAPGAVARLRVYDRALAASEVASLDRLPSQGSSGGTYSMVYSNAALGTYVFTARATDNLGARTTSTPVTVSVNPPGANFADLFAARGTLTGRTNFATANNSGYAREAGEPRHDNRNGARSAWVSWTAPESGVVTMDTFGSSFDTVLGVYTGESVASLLRVTSNDDAGASVQSQASFAAQEGTTYQIVVDGYGSSDAGNIVFHLSLASQLPFIITHPQSFTVNQGAPVTFTVVAGGAQPLAYQWQLAGVDIPGATSDSLLLTNVQTTHAGVYTVIVSNAAGSVTSNPSELIVRVRPTITAHPEPLVVDVGQNAVFTVVASGTEPFNYQWRFNGAALPGQTDHLLTLTNLQYVHGGSYRVVVGNLVGSVNSQPADLIVRPRILQVERLQDGSVRLRIAGVPNSTYVFEVSSNMNAWVEVGQLTLTSTEGEFVDTAAMGNGFRIYRLRLQQP